MRMRILAVETATPRGSVSLVDEEGLIVERESGEVTTHSTWLLPAIGELLAEVGVSPEQVDGFAISAGPGSFTGLRIGLSTVKGLALATGKPVVAVPTLKALAESVLRCRHLICPILDARKKELYAAFFRRHADGSLLQDGNAMVLLPRDLAGRIDQRVLFLGTGVDLYRDLLTECLEEKALFASSRYRYPRAAIVGRLGLGRLARGLVEDPDRLEPLYVRASEAQLKKADRQRL